MFGLMKARTCSLSPDLKRHRRLHYCGTCKTIGSLYGQRSRALLNHDTVFLAELLSALSGADRQLDGWNSAYQSYNCLALPRGSAAMPLVLEYAATATLTLAEFKLTDHVADSGQRRWRLALGFFSKGFRQAAARLAEWNFPVEELRRALLSQSERELHSLNAAASPQHILTALAEPTACATGMFLAHGAALVEMPLAAEITGRIGRAFGELIYLLDAVEDFSKDGRSGDFNALRAAFKTTDERLSAGVRKQVEDRIWSLAGDIESALRELPIDELRARLFAGRLQHNLAHRLGVRLPVVAHTCGTRPAHRKTIRERWSDAVSSGRALAAKRRDAHGSSLAARMASPFVFTSVLPIALLFPQQAIEAGSYRECLGLGLNLMALGSLAAAIAGRLRFPGFLETGGPGLEEAVQEEIGKGKGGRKKTAAGGGSNSSCGCCCDCDCCDCCDGCDGCGSCCDCGDCCSCDC